MEYGGQEAAGKACSDSLCSCRDPINPVLLCTPTTTSAGGMYNIIRGMPLFMRDRNGKIMFFMAGR